MSATLRKTKKHQRQEVTNMDGIRSIAKMLLHLPIEKDPQIPIVVYHPFTTSPVTFLQMPDGPKSINLDIPEDMIVWRERVEKLIDKCTRPMQVYLMVTQSYKTGFLMLAEPYLGTQDLPAIVRAVWQETEYVNAGVNVPRQKFVRLFKECGKEALMDKEELEQLDALPNHVTIYRGVASGKEKSAKSISWTLDPAVAKRFAEHKLPGRSNGKVFTTTVPKTAILALFSDESEVLVNPRSLKEIHEYSPA